MDFLGKSAYLMDFACLLDSCGLNVTVDSLSRVALQSAACLDNILTNLINSGYQVKVLEPCPAVHRAQSLTFRGIMQRPVPIYKKRLTEENFKRFEHLLADTVWTFLF